MTQIYLIRHCEAEGNIYRRAHGSYDGRITAKGQRQIDALAERFRDIPVDAVYSSDLSRTIATAGAVTKYHDIPLQTDRRLREQHLGSWEDVPFGNLAAADPQLMWYFNNDPARWHAPGAETFGEVRARMREIIFALAAKHDGQTVVCVSHGMAIRAFLSELMGLPSADINQLPHGDNTCVALLEIENGSAEIKYYNDNSHLSDELSTFARQHWWKRPDRVDHNNLRFAPLDPNREPELYLHFYAETWKAVHGSLDGFYPPVYLDSAKRQFAISSDAIITVSKDDVVVGITALDMERGKEEGCGWISLCFVEEAERRHLLGVQLIGHAVSTFRKLGRRHIRLSVYEGNEGAIRFYQAYDFHIVGSTEGVIGRLLLMEKDIF